MFSQPQKVSFALPPWIEPFARKYRATDDVRQRMAFVIAAARQNVVRETGGPFAAAIFESDSGALVSLGVNLVTTQGLSVLHAEIVAIALAQKKLITFDLGEPSRVDYDLIASTEPCAMCLGAIIWSGVRRLVTAALDEDARDIGFDEGPKPENWIRTLTDRGLEVMPAVERDAARAVLRFYLESGGLIYNSRREAKGQL